VLGDLLGDAWHFYWTPHKCALVVSEEVDELAFLFGVQASSDLDYLGRVFGVNLYGLSILSRFESVGRGGTVRPDDTEGAWRSNSLYSEVMTMAVASSMLSCS
jgi:hypothetical protein